MPFYLYRKLTKNGEGCFQRIRQVPLAGHNAIYSLWVKQGEPLNQGWHITREELAKELTYNASSDAYYTVLIDYDPSARKRIELLELLDIYAYTSGKKSPRKIWWSPLMLRLKSVFYEESHQNITREQRMKKICRVAPKYGPDIFEFLYLQGDDGGWKWGRVGQVNAPLIEREVREYFKTFFCEGVT